MEHTDVGEPRGLSDRRRFLRTGLAGAAAAALLPALVGSRVGASTPPDGATTTTAPPKRPTEADVELIRFAQSLEHTARDLYDVALTPRSFDPDVAQVFDVFGQHHQAYGDAFSGMLGRLGYLGPNEAMLADLRRGFVGTYQQVARSAYELEDSLVATYIEMIRRLEGVEGANLLSSILIVEAQQAQVMALMAGIDDFDQLLRTNASPLTQAQYPIRSSS